jgi:fructose-1,6-bisphosphatase/inositol monophosphatase family enzyme
MSSIHSSRISTTGFPDPFLARIKAAGDLLCRMQAGSRSLYKRDGSLTTTADLSSQSIILAAIQEFYPNSTVLTEESEDAGELSARFPYLTFLDARDDTIDLPPNYISIDPNDGTAFYANKSDQFSISLGFVENYMPTAGIISQPKQGHLFVSSHEMSSFDSLKATSDIRRSLIGLDICKSVDSSFFNSILWPLIQACRYPENLPSVVSGIHLMQGVTTAWVTSNARNWDVAGVAAMVHRAGGCVQALQFCDGDWQMDLLDWRRVRMPPLLFASSYDTADQILQIVREAAPTNSRVYTTPR